MAFPPRRARRLWAYFLAERRTLRQGLGALLLSTAAGLVAGITLGSISKTLVELPSLFILIPAAVGMKGTIFGAIGARLGTSTHAGLFEVTWDRRGVLFQNVYVGVITTFSSCLYLAALARLAALAFGLRSISFFDFVTISVIGGVLGSAVAMGLTIGLSLVAVRRGYDLDAVSTPIVTASGDMVTIPSLARSASAGTFTSHEKSRAGWNTASSRAAARIRTVGAESNIPRGNIFYATTKKAVGRLVLAFTPEAPR